MAAKFVLRKGSTGKLRFNLVATNGQVIATSEAYESKASAIKGHRVGQAQRPQRRDRRPDRQVAACSARRLYRPCRARPADRSLVAEDRSAAGVRDRTEPEPDAHAVAKSTTDSPRSSSAGAVCDPIEPRPPVRGSFAPPLVFLLEGAGQRLTV